MLSVNTVHPSWRPLVTAALATVDPHYIRDLNEKPNWLPGTQNIFNAFSLPLTETKYILFGESPYPRAESANGYAFWDNAVSALWSQAGLTKPVNRATSLRNIMKMLLITQGYLSIQDTSQPAIAAIDKTPLVSTLTELFQNFLQSGFLLLNAALAFDDKPVKYHVKHWLPFMDALLSNLQRVNPSVQLILFGNMAKIIQAMPSAKQFCQLTSEHPYNISFISNPNILNFFKNFNLLSK